MQEFKGIKLTPKKTYAKFAIIYHHGEHFAEEIDFKTEGECDKVIRQIANGEGIRLQYDFNKKEVIVYPYSAIKIKLMREVTISEKAIVDNKLREKGFTNDVNYPTKFGEELQKEYSHKISYLTNHYKPALVKDNA